MSLVWLFCCGWFVKWREWPKQLFCEKSCTFVKSYNFLPHTFWGNNFSPPFLLGDWTNTSFISEENKSLKPVLYWSPFLSAPHSPGMVYPPLHSELHSSPPSGDKLETCRESPSNIHRPTYLAWARNFTIFSCNLLSINIMSLTI